MDPFIYVYSVGGVIFAVGLVYAWRQGAVGLSGSGLRNLLICCGVMAYFAAIQGYQQYAPMHSAPPKAYDGSADHVLGIAGRTRGESIDYVVVIAYFLAIVAVGTWFGRRQKTTGDFFFGGRRFSWWLIAFSMLATTIGSYSFVKYANKGFAFGLGSSQTYFNDWLWVPLLLFGWLPILYFSRVTSIPEYFGRRFGPTVRLVATVSILIYLVGYVGVNLFTMGKVLNALLGWSIPLSALLVAVISATYVTSGGQTSVIMTDLLQGVMLLFTGLLILWLGVDYLGGFDAFWSNLPRGHRLAFPNFNQDQSFPTVGIFWQDGVANSAMFAFLHQGTMMRYMAARSLGDTRKAVLVQMLVLMTIAACVVGGGGWVARALVNAGKLPDTVQPADAFYVATELLCRPGVFGLVLASLTAALMSTVDTLITAVAAISVNDVYKLYLRPEADERGMLRVARVCSVVATVLGVALVPIFMQFESIYSAHGAFTAAVTPPLVVTMLFAVFWRRFTRAAAISTLLGGLGAVAFSLFVPEVVAPFAHGVPMKDVGDGVLVGMQQYKYMRAAYGLTISAVIGVVVTLFSQPEPWERQRGLVWGSLATALQRIAGVLAVRNRRVLAQPVAMDREEASGDPPGVRLSVALAQAAELEVGDELYVSDTRFWLGGLQATHAVVEEILPASTEGLRIEMDRSTFSRVVTPRRTGKPVRVERTIAKES